MLSVASVVIPTMGNICYTPVPHQDLNTEEETKDQGTDITPGIFLDEEGNIMRKSRKNPIIIVRICYHVTCQICLHNFMSVLVFKFLRQCAVV